ncbi:hypothetical protein FQR65_LT16172 [Abscondita terminalis]|nr:hypothetical protein FQR65_LT16172 [Abscondita terminalis]
MEWSLVLIDYYEKYPVLWNPRHQFYYSKNKKNDAWDELAKELSCDTQTIKNKMNSLLGSFRAQKSKGKKTVGTGKGRKEVYISKWFAFKRMHFLLDRDDPRDTVDTEDVSLSENRPSASMEQPKRGKKRQATTQENPLAFEALRILKDTHSRYIASQTPTVVQDRFYTYGQHVGNKMRSYTPTLQNIVEHEINNVLFRADMGQYNSAAYYNPVQVSNPGYYHHSSTPSPQTLICFTPVPCANDIVFDNNDRWPHCKQICSYFFSKFKHSVSE